ncbi:MAG: hypothetical protein HDKAJFGB_03123 [Anaerolineae bacterium]|nr:hypothetical protein [Anaerolineae bacterium]
MKRADFFFAFDENFEIKGQSAVCAQRFERFERGMDIAFHIRRAARVQIIAAHGWLKRRRMPFVHRVNGLHVVMPIEQDSGLAGRVQGFAVHHRMPRRVRVAGGEKGDVIQSERAQLRGKPFCSALHIGLMFGQCGDGRDGGKSLQFLKKTRVRLTRKGDG